MEPTELSGLNGTRGEPVLPAADVVVMGSSGASIPEAQPHRPGSLDPLDPPGDPLGDPPDHRDPLGGSSENNSSITVGGFSEDHSSHQPDFGDDCATIILACLHCNFSSLVLMLPLTCERALSRCFPSYQHIKDSLDAEAETPPPRGAAGGGCCSTDLSCGNLCGSCEDAADLLELAMEVSEICYR